MAFARQFSPFSSSQQRGASREMGDHWSKNELDDKLRRPTWLDDDADWQTPFGQDYDPNDLYGNLDFTPEFAGGAGKGASDAWQRPGASGKDDKKRTTSLNARCGADGSGRVWSDKDQKCVDPAEVNGCEEGSSPDPETGECVPDESTDPTYDDPFTGTFTAPTERPWPTAPEWRGPDIPDVGDFGYEEWQAPDKFKAPTMEEAQAAPGFKMRMDQGRKALEASAAAKGVLRSGKTYTDLMDYGQQMGEMGYEDVYRRRSGEYDRSRRNLERDYQTGYGRERDIYNIGRENVLGRYASELGEEQRRYRPKEQQWAMEAGNIPTARTQDYNRAWDRFRADEDRFERQQAKENAWKRYLAEQKGPAPGSYRPAG